MKEIKILFIENDKTDYDRFKVGIDLASESVASEDGDEYIEYIWEHHEEKYIVRFIYVPDAKTATDMLCDKNASYAIVFADMFLGQTETDPTDTGPYILQTLRPTIGIETKSGTRLPFGVVPITAKDGKSSNMWTRYFADDFKDETLIAHFFKHESEGFTMQGQFEKVMQNFFQHFYENENKWYRIDIDKEALRFRGCFYQNIITGKSVNDNSPFELPLYKVMVIERVNDNDKNAKIYPREGNAIEISGVKISNIPLANYLEGEDGFNDRLIKVHVRVQNKNSISQLNIVKILADTIGFAYSFYAVSDSIFINPIFFDECYSRPESTRREYSYATTYTPNAGNACCSYHGKRWAFGINLNDHPLTNIGGDILDQIRGIIGVDTDQKIFPKHLIKAALIQLKSDNIDFFNYIKALP